MSKDIGVEQDERVFARIAAAKAKKKALQLSAEPDDEIWFEDNNGAMRSRPKDCQRFDANGVPVAVWINRKRYAPDDTVPATDDVALLRQALEALEGTTDFIRDDHHVWSAVAALRERLGEAK